MKLKIIPALFILISLTACSENFSLTEEQQLQLTDDQRIEKAKYDFDQKDYDASLKNLKLLAEKNNKEAMYALGYQYYYGLGVDKNNVIAQDYIRKSADLGYKPAIRALRQFMIAKSTFVVDTKKPSYLAFKDNGADLSNSSNNKIIDNNDDDTNAAIDQLLEDTKTVKQEPLQSKTKITHGFGFDEAKITEAASTTEVSEKASITKKTELREKKRPIKVAAKPKNKSKATDIWDSSIKVSANDAKIINKIAEAAKAKQLKEVAEFNDEPDEDKISIVDTENKFKDTTEPENNIVTSLVDATKPTGWLQQQNPSDFTIQINASNNRSDIEQFITNNNLQNKVKAFSYLYNNQTWYGAGYGVYNKPSDAYQALLEELPADIKIKKPWVRQFKNIVPANVG